MSFWRKLNKVFFTLSLVFSIIAVVGGSIAGFMMGSLFWLGFVILGAGLILIPAMFSIWGIFLEFIDNVAAIKRKICNGNGGGYLINANIGAAAQTATAGQTDAAGAQYVARQFDNDENWNCQNCGKKNEAEATFCYNCGTPKV